MLTVAVDPLTEFFDAIKSPMTKDRYEKRLDIFLKHIGSEGSTLKERAADFASKAQDTKWATSVINDYMRYQKQRAEKGEISESTVSNFYKPIKLFLNMNDITLNWRKITIRFPKGRSYGKDRAPSIQEIKQVLAYPDRRIKPVILLMVSSGIRIGAFEGLDWGHIELIERAGQVLAAKVKVYAGDVEEYTTMITPESYRALKEYIDYRASQGEKTEPSSPLIRDLFQPDRCGYGWPKIPKRLKANGVKRLIEDSLQTVRKPLEKGKRRHEFQAAHGFRKFFKSRAERTMKSLNVEMLLGHDTGLAENYYRPSESELLEDYVKAIPDLTILEEVKATPEIQDLKKSYEELKTIVLDFIQNQENLNNTLEERFNRIEIERLKEKIK